MLTLALIALLVWSVTPAARAATGDLDPTFGGYGSGGRVISDPFPGVSINATAGTSDGKLIAVGTDGQDFVVVRYLANGKLDPTFGTNGVTTLDFAGQADVATAAALTGDAKSIVVVGTATVGVHSADFAITRLHADGTPDTSFSQDGKTTIDFNGRHDRATAVLLVDTHMLVAGAVEESPPGGCLPACNDDFGFVGLTQDGSPSSFGTNGKNEISFGGSAVPRALTVGLNGTFYVAGTRSDGAHSEYVIARLNGHGDLDTFFNSSGYRTGSIPVQFTGLVSLGDGAVLASGDAGGDFGLVRFNFGGGVDTDWGTAGLATVDFGGDDSPGALHQEPGGTFVVAGSSGTRLVMVHLTDKGQVVPGSGAIADLGDTGAETVRALAAAAVPDVRLWVSGALKAGSTTRLALLRRFLDDTPDDGGRQAADFGDGTALASANDQARSAVFQSDGKLVVAGWTEMPGGQKYAALARYTAAGALDPAFGDKGRLILSAMLDGAVDIALQADGKIVVLGGSFDLARLNADGSPDMSFNGTGYARVSVDAANSNALAIQPDGRIVVAGGKQNFSTFVLARLTGAGAPDSSFGFDGIVRTGFGLQADAFDVVIQPNGKIVVVGRSVVTQTDYNVALARYNADGSLDVTFDGDGKVTTDFGSADWGYAVALEPSGAILAAGISYGNGALFARYRPDGSLDPSFNGSGKQTVQILGDDVGFALVDTPSGITAALTNFNQTTGLVVRLTPAGQLDKTVHGDGRLPFHFAGINCPLGLASAPGRVAAVGYAQNMAPTGTANAPTADFAVAVYQDPVPAPGSHQVYLPYIQR